MFQSASLCLRNYWNRSSLNYIGIFIYFNIFRIYAHLYLSPIFLRYNNNNYNNKTHLFICSYYEKTFQWLICSVENFIAHHNVRTFNEHFPPQNIYTNHHITNNIISILLNITALLILRYLLLHILNVNLFYCKLPFFAHTKNQLYTVNPIHVVGKILYGWPLKIVSFFYVVKNSKLTILVPHSTIKYLLLKSCYRENVLMIITWILMLFTF